MLEFLKRRRLRRELEESVGPELAAKLFEARDPDELFISEMHARRVDYILALVNGATAADIVQAIGKVVDTAIAASAVVETVLGPLVVITLGPIADNEPYTPKHTAERIALVEELWQKAGHCIKVVHGAADGHRGNLGSRTRFAFTFLVPDFGSILGQFHQMEDGEIREFKHGEDE